jgi:hypothetical protein
MSNRPQIPFTDARSRLVSPTRRSAVRSLAVENHHAGLTGRSSTEFIKLC